jgi:uncharacterized protein YndB with AHSA1/START domain
VDLRVGGAYRVHMRSPDGTEAPSRGVYREVDPRRNLVYTWTGNQSEMGETLVTVEFLERGRATEVVLKHELFPADEPRDLHAHGWNGSLDKLAKILSNPKQAPERAVSRRTS